MELKIIFSENSCSAWTIRYATNSCFFIGRSAFKPRFKRSCLFSRYGADVTAKDAGKTPLDVYNSELTNLDGSSPSWRGEKNSETAQNLTPEKKGFSILGWIARNSGR